jgi:hypothetical protein
VPLLTGVSLWQALIKSSEHLKNNRNKAHGSIYSCTAGVVFLGTPHRGSDKVGLAKLVSNVAKVAFRQPNNNLVHSLDEDSDALERQRDSFTSISKDMPLVCLFEELPTGIGLVSFQFPFLACCLFFGGGTDCASALCMSRWILSADRQYSRKPYGYVQICERQ